MDIILHMIRKLGNMLKLHQRGDAEEFKMKECN